MKKIVLFALTASLLSACTSTARTQATAWVRGPRLAEPTIKSEVKTKVAMMVGPGAVGAAFNWMQVLSFCPQMEVKFVDGRMIREGALEGCDVYVCPGGYDRQIYRDIGREGAEVIREFIRKGGCYLGTCAGAIFTLNDAKGYGLSPWKQDPTNSNFAHGHAQIVMSITKRGSELMGVPASNRFVWYWNGPLMIPAPIEGMKSEVLATYHGDILMNTTNLLRQAGYPAMVSVEFGKGKMVVSSCHPEITPRTHDIVAGAFKYLTGRDYEFRLPQRQHGGLEVGIYTGQLRGVKTAETLMAISTLPGVNAKPISTWGIRDGALDGVDVVVFPDGNPSKNMVGEVKRQFQAFEASGGRCLAWGTGVQACTGLDIEDVKSGEGAIARLTELSR